MASHFTLRFDEDVKEEFDRYCNENFISRNKLINKLIKDFLQNIKHDSLKNDKTY